MHFYEMKEIRGQSINVHFHSQHTMLNSFLPDLLLLKLAV